jgi:hypothetical protein
VMDTVLGLCIAEAERSGGRIQNLLEEDERRAIAGKVR